MDEIQTSLHAHVIIQMKVSLLVLPCGILYCAAEKVVVAFESVDEILHGRTLFYFKLFVFQP